MRRVPHLLANTNKFVRLHGERGKTDVGRVDAHILQLKMLLELRGIWERGESQALRSKIGKNADKIAI